MKQEAWRSQRSFVESWESQRPSEPPTLTLDAFEQDAGFAALAWTRATSRCITDWQGNVHEIPASAKPRNGVRVVQNLAQGSEGAAGIGSYVDGCAIASTTDYLADPASTLWKATENSATGVHMFEWVTLSWVSGVKYTVSIYVRENGRSFLWLAFAGIAGLSACYDLNAGSVGSVGADTTAGIERHGDLYRCWLTFEATYTGSTAMRAYLRTTDGLSSETYAGDGSSGIYVTAAQCQRARPGQSEPDEYVSNGVLATPYHDGIGVDGLKYFATDENGALITGTRGYRRRKNWVSAPLTAWTSDGAAVSGGVMTSTGGNNRAYKVFTNLPSGPMFGFSCEVRAGTSPTVRFSFINIQDGPTYTFATDAWTPSGSFLQGRELLADGWIRLWVYRTSNTTSWGPGIYLGSNSTMEIRNPQLEIFETGQTTPTAYIPTTTSAVEVVDASFDVNPIVPSIPVGVAQTNRITYPSDLSNAAWTKRGTCTATAGYDAQVGTYTRIAGLAEIYAGDVFFYNTGFSVSARIEPAMLCRAVTTSGTVDVRNPMNGDTLGHWTINLALLSATRFEWVTRNHPAVTITTEFVSYTDGRGGVWFVNGSGGSIDVARVAQVQGERVHGIPVEATAVSTINADVPVYTVLPTYATNNEGTFVFDFTPHAELARSAVYFEMSNGPCYKNSGNSLLYQYDGTTASNYGNQVEGTRTKISTSWQTGVGRYGYRDGVSKFAAVAYDGVWQIAAMTLTGPMRLHRMLIHRSAEAMTYLQGVTSE